VGLIEREHVKGIFVDSRIYSLLAPLSAKKVHGTWTPPLAKNDILTSVKPHTRHGHDCFFGLRERWG